ncbi:MAG: aldo/keto reductase [Candidatus Omnitrophica bacterium]|nr:aldo/keto reductase [Candidatus Omnitrophota bacterium]MCB9747871.1 aldo/keto reductase [Candidatus Omnitrophota bacterium]
MQFKTLGNSNLNVSVIGLGTWVFGGDLWGGNRESDSIDAISACLDYGVNFIDTAPIYGDGRSEEIIGRAIRKRRDKVIIATKCGLIKKGREVLHDLSPQSILSEIDDSLRRLRCDYIDLYQCHWPDERTPINETLTTLLDLVQKEKIRYIGISNYPHNLMNDPMILENVVSLQSQYSILDRKVEKEDLPFCGKHNIGFIAYGVLGGGVLSGKYKTTPEFKKPDARKLLYKFYTETPLEKINKFLNSLEEINRPFHEIAINWIRQKKFVGNVLVGCRNHKQVIDNVKAVQWSLTKEEIALIDQFHL